MKSVTKTNAYFDFLCDIVWLRTDDIDEEKEILLLRELHGMEFYPLIPNDDNRCMDGIQLRDTYLDDGGPEQALPSGSCTVLEMLIGLSYRLVFETEQSRWEKTTQQWFWILIDNLGLNLVTNNDLSIEEYREKIEENVTNFLNRHYKSNGEGGLFPLKKTRKDQKRVEIWYQMSDYILENYPI